MTDTTEVWPCGCLVRMIGEMFEITPCSVDCENYNFALEQVINLDKPVEYRMGP